MSNLAVMPANDKTSLAMSEEDLIDVLQSSLYPGAALNSIKMVIGYCKAANLDPMQKPVHIVPMWDKNAKQMRDVIMPGVGLYRTQAARSNALAGISEPEFGPMVEFELDGLKVTVPEWCRVVVKRMLAGGAIAEFAAIEYWIENYATAGKDSVQPNAMWKKRPRGQLAKCAQAQALRMAFPEMVGSAPTADEMEGKHLDAPEVDITPRRTEQAAPQLGYCTPEKFSENQAAWRQLIVSGKKSPKDLIATLETKTRLTEDQKLTIDSWSHEND
ncbi:MAG TPA: phage recombination protein Bet [Noviherbaspirillum sp.]|nr:phage recombination protein Bet [Noviherbaspirillum sp.]